MSMCFVLGALYMLALIVVFWIGVVLGYKLRVSDEKEGKPTIF